MVKIMNNFINNLMSKSAAAMAAPAAAVPTPMVLLSDWLNAGKSHCMLMLEHNFSTITTGIMLPSC